MTWKPPSPAQYTGEMQRFFKWQRRPLTGSVCRPIAPIQATAPWKQCVRGFVIGDLRGKKMYGNQTARLRIHSGVLLEKSACV